MSCEDPDCPGCIMEGVIEKLSKMGFEPDDMMTLFFDMMRQKFDTTIIVTEERDPTEALH